MRLATERLVIRSFIPQDAEALHERVFSLPEAMRFIPKGAIDDVERTRRSVARYIEHERTHGFSLWAVLDRGSGEFIGSCGLVLVEGKGPEVELAYHFTPPSWGHGYATEAARASLAYGFEEAGLERIIAICAPEHTASRRVMEKSGMRLVGPCRYYDMDLVKYERERGPGARG